MSPTTGRSFGGYRLHRAIANDAISTTYHATTDGGAPDTGRGQFAVRIVRGFQGSGRDTTEVVRQFLAAAQEAGAIDHPSIVRPRDLGVIDGRPYVASPLVRAVPLGRMLARGGSIRESAALALFAQLAGGLDAAHRAGVVHATLSPLTIWVGPNSGQGAAYVGYVTGFGSSKLLREWLARDTRPAPLDDLLYVAPEQVRGDPVTGATDQYALACALYHTLSGEPPFEAETRAKLYGAHLMAPAPALRAIDPVAARSTSSALQRAMDKQPARRHPSCGMFINAALPVMSGRAADDATSEPAPSAAALGTSRQIGSPTQMLRRPLVQVGIGVLLIGLVLWLLSGPGRGTAAATTPAGPDPAVVASLDATVVAGDVDAP